MATGARTAKVCGSHYVRNGVRHDCTFMDGHALGQDPTPHSYQWMIREDENAKVEAEARGVGCDDDTPADVKALLDAITVGNADPYLEAILAVTHNRKRALRGTRGFGRL